MNESVAPWRAISLGDIPDYNFACPHESRNVPYWVAIPSAWLSLKGWNLYVCHFFEIEFVAVESSSLGTQGFESRKIGFHRRMIWTPKENFSSEVEAQDSLQSLPHSFVDQICAGW